MSENERTRPVLSVVIPAYNEGANVTKVVDDTIQALAPEWSGRYELVLVDDGSADDTASFMSLAAEKHACVRVFRNPSNKGLGGALQTGYREVRGDYVSFIPGDGQVTVSEVVKLHSAIGTAALIVGTRHRSEPAYRDILSWGMRTLTRILLGFDPKGMDGLYVIKRDVLQGLRLRSTTGFVNYEIFMGCYRAGLEVRRGLVITDTRPRISGNSKVTNLRTIAKSFWEMLKLRLAR